MRYLVFVITILLSTNLLGSQSQFSKTDKGKEVSFDYAWIDHNSQTQSLSATLKKSASRAHYSTTKAFRPKIAQQNIYTRLLREARKINPKDARISIKRVGDELDVQVSTRQPDTLLKWQQTMAEKKSDVRKTYLNENYYVDFTNHLNEKGVRPDHQQYIKESVELLRPFAQVFYESISEDSDSRQYVNLVLSWIQSIPNAPQLDRIAANGKGFEPPLKMLNQNIGSSDSKATTFAAILRGLLPKSNLVMVYLPGNTLVGINLPRRDDEQAFNLGGINYMMMEVSGPSSLKTSELTPETLGKMNGRMYKYSRIP